MDRTEISQADTAKILWRKYRSTPEYKSGRRYSISSVHPLVRKGEEQGLENIILNFARELEHGHDLRAQFIQRTEHDWLGDWQNMHATLFRSVYRDNGHFRPKGYDVRFGDPGDENLHHIPRGGGEVYNEIFALARTLKDSLEYVKIDNLDEVCLFLARFHYNFIRIHPFFDGNGRIARVVTDELAVVLGYVPIIAGFPRNNLEKKQIYHAAIRAAAFDSSCHQLAIWIKAQMLDKLAQIN